MTVENFKRAEKIMQDMNELEEIQRMVRGNGLHFARKYNDKVKLSPEINPYMKQLISIMIGQKLEKLKNEFESL